MISIRKALQAEDGDATNLRAGLVVIGLLLGVAALVPPEQMDALIERVTSNLASLAAAFGSLAAIAAGLKMSGSRPEEDK